MAVRRQGVTIVELMVVLSIIALLLGLLVPAVQSARERARETVCKNNLHQLSVTVNQFIGVHKQLPQRGSPAVVGGWAVALLPFLEQGNLYDRIRPGMPLADAPEFLNAQPRIFRCPIRSAIDASMSTAVGAAHVEPAHYVLVRHHDTQFDLFDSPLNMALPWATGPEMPSRKEATRTEGPHRGGYFYTRGYNQGIGFTGQGG